MSVYTEEQLKKLMRDPAYGDPQHKDHKKIQRVVKQGFKNLYPGDDRNINPDNYYVWRTEGDDRVRDSHAERDGEVFSWKNPPSGGHPGEDWGCRCWAEEYVPAHQQDKPITPIKKVEKPVKKQKEKESQDTKPALKEEASNSPNLMDLGLYASTGAMQGLSLGWSDEIEGALGGLGYGIGSLIPQFNTKNESFTTAYKRGYETFKQIQRQDLREGYQKAPVLTGSSEALGAAISPVGKFFKAPPHTSSWLYKRINLVEAFSTAGLYSIGMSEGNLLEDSNNFATGAGVNIVSALLANKFWGKTGHEFGRVGMNTILNTFANQEKK